MTHQRPAVDPAETFTAAASEYGVTTRRVPAEEAPAAIEKAVVPPVVGTPLPWDDIPLPGSVRTDPTAASPVRTGSVTCWRRSHGTSSNSSPPRTPSDRHFSRR